MANRQIISITMDPDVWTQFKQHCQKKAIKPSRLIEEKVRQEIKW